MFIASHTWALETATPLTVASVGPDAETATAPFATTAALVAMKLHAIQDRSGDSQAKRADDAWDLHQLLTLHNRAGAISAALRDAPAVLTTAVRQAADVVLVTGATRTRSWLRTSGGVQATIGADEIRALGRQLLDGWTGPDGRPQTGPNAGDSVKSVATSLATSSEFVILPGELHPL